LGPEDAGDEKTHDRCQPWVFVEIVQSPSTSPDGVVFYDDAPQVDLPKIANHKAQFRR
jgi:hypothetical protein